jgi:hypothetical protein
MHIKSLILLSASLGLGTLPSHAGIVTHTGNTATAPTYNRPVEDLSGLSDVGSAVRYDSYAFSVGAAGNYSFLNTAQFDAMSFLYAPALDPSRPLVNARIGNDDLVSLSTSGFAYDLVPGVAYTLVTTGFGSADSGFFSSTIGGPGPITPAPPQRPPTAPANIVTYTGDTTAAPTFARLLPDLSAASDVGTEVAYDAFGFRVSSSGSYSFLGTGEFDAVAFLYESGFDPLRPGANARFGNDDLVSATTSGFAYELVAGIDYPLVTTGFGNADRGAFSNTIGGPGAIVPTATAVPAPGSLALALAALAAGAGALRRTNHPRARTGA